jgi:arsenite methyltransferase
MMPFLDELPLWSAPFGLKLLQHIPYRQNMQVLDIGSGTGFPIIELAMRLGRSSRLYGLEPSADAIKRIREKLRFLSIRNVFMIRGSAEAMRLEDDAVDLIVSNNGLNNCTDPAQALIECGRVLRSGGQLIQTFNLPGTMKEFYKVLEEVLKQNNLQNSITLMQEQIATKRRPVSFYIQAGRNAGLTLTNLEEDRFVYQFADADAMLKHFFIQIAFLDSWQKLVPESHRKKVFAQTKIKLNQQARLDGQLTFTIPFALMSWKKK